jgi:hypothetical protein
MVRAVGKGVVSDSHHDTAGSPRFPSVKFIVAEILRWTMRAVPEYFPSARGDHEVT